MDRWRPSGRSWIRFSYMMYFHLLQGWCFVLFCIYFLVAYVLYISYNKPLQCIWRKILRVIFGNKKLHLECWTRHENDLTKLSMYEVTEKSNIVKSQVKLYVCLCMNIYVGAFSELWTARESVWVHSCFSYVIILLVATLFVTSVSSQFSCVMPIFSVCIIFKTS